MVKMIWRPWVWAALLGALPGAAISSARAEALFCPDVLDVSEQTEDCPGNGTFLQAARACETKLNGMETQLGEATQVVASGGASAQAAKTKTGAQTYRFTAASAAQLAAAATTGLAQLSAYPDYVFLPGDAPEVYSSEDGDPYPSAGKAQCYQATLAGLAQAQQFFTRKLALYKALEGTSAKNDASLDTDAGNLGSLFSGDLNGAPAPAPAKGASPTKRYDDSDITGTPKESAPAQP